MATPALTMQNYYSSSLAQPVSTTDTTIYLNSLPTGVEGYLEIDEGTATREIIYYTSKGANFVTCPSVAAGRGIGGTSAAAHSTGGVVKQKVNAEVFTELQAGRAMKDSDNSTVGLNPSTLYDSSDRIADYIKPGTGVVAISSGLIGTISNVTFYQAGKRYTMTSIANKTYTASKDTYVDITAGSAAPTYNEVANGAASPALAANSIRLAKVVTGASITGIFQSTVDSTNAYYCVDSLGNAIARRSPYRHSTMSEMTADGTLTLAGAFVDLPNLATITKITTGGECEVDFVAPVNNGTSAVDFSLGVAVDGTMQNDSITRTRGTTGGAITQQVCRWRGYLAAGAHTFKIQYHLTGSGTVSVYGVKGGTSAFGDVRTTLRVTETI